MTSLAYFELPCRAGRKVKAADDVYVLTIYLLYHTLTDAAAAEQAANGAKEAIEKSFKATCCPKNDEWSGKLAPPIVLAGSLVNLGRFPSSIRSEC